MSKRHQFEALIVSIVLSAMLNTSYAENLVETSGITPEDIVSCTNAYRESQGLNPLVLNNKLTQAATYKAADIVEYKYWAHINPTTKKEPWDFIEESKYEYETAGENLAFDFQNAQAACDTLMESPTHRANILDENYQEIGVAIEYADINIGKGNLIVQIFGSRDDFRREKFSMRKRILASNELKNCYNSSLNGLTILSPGCGVINNAQPEIQIELPAENYDKVSLTLNGHKFKGQILSASSGGKIFEWSEMSSLLDGVNKIVVEAVNKKNGDKEAAYVSVILDREPPQIAQEEAKIILAAEDSEDLYDVSIKVEDENPGKVYLAYKNEEGDAISEELKSSVDDYYYGKLKFPAGYGNQSKVMIKAYDKANNAASTEILVRNWYVLFGESKDIAIQNIIAIIVIFITCALGAVYYLRRKGIF